MLEQMAGTAVQALVVGAGMMIVFLVVEGIRKLLRKKPKDPPR